MELLLNGLRLLWGILSPDKLFYLLIFVGIGLSYSRYGYASRVLLLGVFVVILILSVLPVTGWIFNPLERRFSTPDLSTIESPDGIIVLSGAERTRLSIKINQPVLSESAERLITFVSLAFRYPNAKLIVSDGPTLLKKGKNIGAHTAKQLFSDLGLNADRVIFEERSSNTYENAKYSNELIKPEENEKWWLITSAYHMPRAVACFRKFGWNVIPYPVDFQGEQGIFSFNPHRSLSMLSLSLKEWFGLLVYRITGKTLELFPS